MTKTEYEVVLRGAAWMREKIARCLAASPRKEIYEGASHVREKISLPSSDDLRKASEFLDKQVASFDSERLYDCDAEPPGKNGYMCTLAPGHDGDHVAEGAKGEVCYRWPNEN